MTNGYATMPVNAPTSAAYEAEWKANQDKAWQESTWQQEGARLLGYVELSEGVWQQRGQEQAGNLPTVTVQEAPTGSEALANARQTRTVCQRPLQDRPRLFRGGSRCSKMVRKVPGPKSCGPNGRSGFRMPCQRYRLLRPSLRLPHLRRSRRILPSRFPRSCRRR